MMMDGQQQYRNLAAAVFTAANDDREGIAERLERYKHNTERKEWIRRYLDLNAVRLRRDHERAWKSSRRVIELAIKRAKKIERETVEAEFEWMFSSKEMQAKRTEMHKRYARRVTDEVKSLTYTPLTEVDLQAKAEAAFNKKLRALRREKEVIDDLFSGPSLWSDLLDFQFG